MVAWVYLNQVANEMNTDTDYMFFENTYWLFRNGNELYLAKGRKKWSLH
jgi:hypothetical protein